MKKADIMGFNTHHEQTFHVLVVDDSLLDRKLLERLLTLSSYNVTCVESGDKALEYLGLLHDHDLNHTPETKVNLIMTDYSMPGMTGYDLLKIVKQSSWKDVPVVVMSAENEPSRINMCLEERAEDFLLKPVQLADVKRLQPHLIKSAVTNSEIIGNNSNADEDLDKMKAAISSAFFDKTLKL